MILRNFQWICLLTWYLFASPITAQTAQTAGDGKTYDTNEWIPITPSNTPDQSQKAQGRVLNLDTPNQNFFPENDSSRKTIQPQQYIRQSVVPKHPKERLPKAEQPYKYEPVLPLQPPQYIQQTQFLQEPHFIQPVPYVQTIQQAPIQESTLNQQLVAPPQNNQNYYQTNRPQHFDIQPVNSTYYKVRNLGSINQELLGAIQHQNVNPVPITTTTTTTTIRPKEEKETVQLLYVPLENLKTNQQIPQKQQRNVYRQQTQSPRREKQISRSQNQRQSQLVTNIEDDFIRQALAAHKLQEQLQQVQPLVFETTTTTTPKPKKRKPNQPPLAVYMEKQGTADVKDVLDVLKQSKSISVQDTVGPNSPQVFIGPSNLDPEGYTKFPLPYLSNVQGNRIERKVEQLPFFVAPLSYKTPEGYSKIPLPSPHVGSVVVSTKEQLHEKNNDVRQPQESAQNQIVQDFDVKQPFDTNPYLLNQNVPQTHQNTIPGFGDDFLEPFTNIGLQNYNAPSQRRYPDDYQSNTKKVRPQSPPKNFITNLQLGLGDGQPQLYETTPTYKTEEQNDYQYPNYQVNDRGIPNQNTREVVRDYDIPSVPVETKTRFAPNYQSDEREENIRDYTTPKSQSLYTYNQEPRVTTTTTNKPSVITQNDFVAQTPPNYRTQEYNPRPTSQRDPYSQVINQYEIEQINNQFSEEKTKPALVEPVRTTIPPVISTQKYNYDASTTVRSRGRARHRGRKTTTTTSTTPNAIAEDKYTILEQFDIQPKTSTVKYTTEVETIPAKVYKLEPQSQIPEQLTENIYKFESQPQTIPDKIYNYQTQPQQSIPEKEYNYESQTQTPRVTPDKVFTLEPQQQSPQTIPDKVYNYESQTQVPRVIPDKTFDLKPRQQPPQTIPENVYNYDTQTQLPQIVPDKVYNLKPEQPPQTVFNYESQTQPPQVLPDNVYTIKTQQPVYIPTQTPRSEHVLDQATLDQQILRVNPPSRNSAPENSQNPRLTPLVQNRGQYQQEEPAPQENPYLTGLINNLENQAVRHLLVPNLLVPTTEKLTTIAEQPTTEKVQIVYSTTASTTTTTEAPTTTQRRSRGRQRAHNARYSTSTSTPRRNVSRRRPNYTRATTERSTTEISNYEPTRRVTNNQSRQRFRTRGRPLKEQATERVLQTTETVFRKPQLEGGFQASSGDPKSYIQFDHVVENQQIITVKPEERPMKEYHQVYSLPSQSPSTQKVVEEYITTSKPVVDVKIAHAVTDKSPEPVIVTTPSDRYIRINNNIQSGGVYNNRRDEVTKAPVRARIRSRTRSRFSSTTSRPTTTTTRITTTTTPKPQLEESEEDEYYGFIRKPNYNKPAPIIQTTHQPLPLYSASYQEPARTLIQLEDEGAESKHNQNYDASSSNPVQFVGQIRPKYTTEQPEYSTEAPRVRQRARIRIPSRKTNQQAQQSYNEVKSHRLDDQVTRRSGVVRTRSRGKSHFKPPASATTKIDDYDVEGGNYPAPYLKQLTTEKPTGFQITVDPPEDDIDQDQEPHSSIFSPQIIRNTDTQWVEASILPSPNELQIEDNQMFDANNQEQSTYPTEEIDEESETNKPEEITESDKIEDETEAFPTEEETLATTEFIETTTAKRRKIGRRRGVWKLVKHKPVDTFETAESQNYYSVLNDFDQINKQDKKSYYKTEQGLTSTSSTTTTSESTTMSPTITTTTTTTSNPPTKKDRVVTTTTTESSIFEALYSMLGFASKASQAHESKTKIGFHKKAPKQQDGEISTTTASPTFPEEITEEITTQEFKITEDAGLEGTTIVPTTTTEATVKNYDVEPWNTHEIKTSTSTEISHETEICYKGKCIKSKDADTNS